MTVANVSSVPGVDRIKLEAAGPTPFVAEFAMNDRTKWTSFRGNLRVGTYSVQAPVLAADDSILYESAQVSATVSADSVTPVVLVLNPVEDGEGPDNHVPFFEYITADKATVLPGGQVKFTVQVNDWDGDALTLTAQGCDAGCAQVVGTFVPANVHFVAAAPQTAHQADLLWTAPQTEGTYRIRFQVEDAHEASSTAEIDIRVGEAVGAIEAELRINFAPVVTKITVSQESGDTIHLTASANDDHSSALDFAWANDGSACDGTFSDDAAATTIFTVTDFVVTEERCALTLTVTDEDGASTVTKIYVEKERFELTYAPALFLRFQSQDDAKEGEVLVFEVEAEVVGTETVDFTWVVPGASPTITQDDVDLVSTLAWTAALGSVACDPGNILTIVATATGADSNKTSEPVEFQVTVDSEICEP